MSISLPKQVYIVMEYESEYRAVRGVFMYFDDAAEYADKIYAEKANDGHFGRSIFYRTEVETHALNQGEG